MMKRVVCLAVLLVLLAPGSLWKTQDYGPLEVYIPSGWKNEDLEDNVFRLSTHDNQIVAEVVWAHLGGLSLEELAQAMSEQLHGNRASYDENLDVYRLTKGLLRKFDSSDIAVSIEWMSGASIVSEAQIEQILDSVRLKQ